MEIDDKPFDKLVFIEKGADSAEALLTLANEFPGRRIEIIQSREMQTSKSRSFAATWAISTAL